LLPKTNGKKTTVADAIYDLPNIKSGEGREIDNYPCEPLSDYQKLMRKGSKGIYNHQATRHSELALKKLSMIPKGMGKEVLPKELLTKSIFSGTWTRLKEDGFAPTITTRFDTPSSGMFTHPILDRCIFYGTKSSQLKQVGNAVPPLLAYSIAKLIKKDNDNENLSR